MVSLSVECATHLELEHEKPLGLCRFACVRCRAPRPAAVCVEPVLHLTFSLLWINSSCLFVCRLYIVRFAVDTVWCGHWEQPPASHVPTARVSKVHTQYVWGKEVNVRPKKIRVIKKRSSVRSYTMLMLTSC